MCRSKLKGSTKYCRFCANHGVIEREKEHRGKCEYRYDTCEKCIKNAKKVQTAKNHRMKKSKPQNCQLNDPPQDMSLSINHASTLCGTSTEYTEISQDIFIGSNWNDDVEDLLQSIGNSKDGTINNVNSDENQSSFIQNLPDDNINEIEMFGTCDVPLPQPEATSDEWLKMSNDETVESLISEHEYETDTAILFQALLNACGGDYIEASRYIIEAKEKISKMD